MRRLDATEVATVEGGIYDGQCNVELAGYRVATASIVAVSGPIGWGFYAAGWAIAAYGAVAGHKIWPRHR